MKRLSFIVLAGIACASTPLVAAAEPDGTGFYVGLGGGTASVDLKKSELDAALAYEFYNVGLTFEGTTNLDKNDTAFEVDVGYRFSPYLALEASYLDLGKAKYSASGLFDGTPGSVTAEIKSSGPALSLVGTYPFASNWSLEARIGAYDGKTEVTASASDTTGFLGSDSASKTKATVMGGVGIGYTFTPNWTVQLRYTYFDKIGDQGTVGTASVNAATLGVRFAF